MLVSLLGTYVLLAPKNAVIPGFEMGAFGLAGKMVVFQFAAVTAYQWVLSRLHEWPFLWVEQAKATILCIITGYTGKIVSLFILPNSQQAAMGLSCIASTIIIVYLYKKIFVSRMLKI
jgi:hypothetical protein